MPLHDWACIEAGIFHDFHQAWTVEILHAMNWGGLPPGFFATVGEISDDSDQIPICSLRSKTAPADASQYNGISVADAPPKARFVVSAESQVYARRANRIVIRERLRKAAAVIEIVSPGNKCNQHAMRSFAEKAADLLRQRINLLVVDLCPPSRRDPRGIHGVIWEQFQNEPFELPADKPLTVAAYSAGELVTAYVESVAVGDLLPAMPIFLDARTYVPAPLEPMYQSTWEKCPEPIRELVENSPG